ncbi:DUF3656 domain-containing protein [Dehalobacter sp. DCM]|uniref:U32 family peptidase n=1 Tax=Dehalobacter sp. DCM TaxID=2907827 RepID=UPI003081F477|nr:DUF3656 domain-containing protein [Dehalobacter sp. DCM]
MSQNDATAGKQPGSDIRKKIELLAPAGGFEALKAAVENGANAVYLGGKLFNARASAANFDMEEFQKALLYAHERHVKIYVTLNILAADSEFRELEDYVYALYTMGADALIVQDIGVAHMVKEVLPEMPLHASTQMTQNNSLGLKQLEKMGFSRVVLAREASAKEIEEIVQATNLDVEVFGHGALCFSYSGQCLMSSYIGGRSGNRGRCAQPCRMTYNLVNKKGIDLLEGQKLGDHLLSPRDLKLIDELEELQRIGVSSLKIEGRMKRPEYVATVIRIYRKALDALYEQNKPFKQGIDTQDKYELTQIFNRDFTTGFFKGYAGADMMSFSRPNNRGTMLGRITDIKSNRLSLKLDTRLNVGDGLEIWTKRGREGITVGEIYTAGGRTAPSAEPGETVRIEFPGSAKIGDRVFKTHDETLISKARISYQEGKETRKRPLRMRICAKIGEKLLLEVQDANTCVHLESQSVAQTAQNKPLTKEYLMKQLGRLGNTPFYLQELTLELEGELIIPVSEVNELRRLAVEKLLETARNKPTLTKKEFTNRVFAWDNALRTDFEHIVPSRNGVNKGILGTAIIDPKMAEPLLKAGADRIILGGEHWRTAPKITLSQLRETLDICHNKGKELVWRLPRIVNQQQSDGLFKVLKEIALWQKRPTMMAANLAEIEMITSLDPEWPWQTDFYFYVFNTPALHWARTAGSRGIALSTELSQEQLSALPKVPGMEMVVFGDMEMMISEFCLLGAVLNDGQGDSFKQCGEICQRSEYYLKDRMSYLFPLATDHACRMHIFNARTLNLVTELAKIADMGIRNIRLELLRATPIQAEKAVRIFKELWINAVSTKSIEKDKTEEAMKNLEALYPEGFTKGHFYRGVLS